MMVTCTRGDCERDRAETGECHCSVYGDLEVSNPKTLLDGFGEATEEVVRLRAENERLRVALDNIAIQTTHPGLDPTLKIDFIREIVAEATLARPKDG